VSHLLAPLSGKKIRRIHAIAILMAVLLCGSSAAEQATIAQPQDTTAEPSKFRSAEDGWLDVGGFLDQKYGFLPVVIPITEPAVGYGAAGGLTFLSKPLGEARATSRSWGEWEPRTVRGAQASLMCATG
jgi:hypothetical protein